LVVIPTKEMEAWLLSDSAAIKNTFNLKGKVKITTNVEMIDNPKERLRDLIWKKGKKRYLNTVHNKKIANIISLKALRKCESFKPLDVYIKRYLRAN
jgi:dissimilatory sulfite reductase (desulfoviridin) alpha/beta subunit